MSGIVFEICTHRSYLEKVCHMCMYMIKKEKKEKNEERDIESVSMHTVKRHHNFL